MSKIRVYELAKELGLENKIILDLADNLSIDGKKSHSSTLSDDEADRIRRSVIRQAVSDKDGLVRRIEKEGNVLTERRVGNVIRRRKRDEIDDPAATPQIDLAEVPKSSNVIPSLVPDHAQEKSARAEALARANALFSDRKEEKAPVIEAAPEPMAEEASSADDYAEPEVEVESASFSEPEEVEETFEAEGEAVPEVEVVEEIEVPVASAADVAVARERVRLAEVRARHDIRAPKVLGKIELPQRPEPVKRVQESREPAKKDASAVPGEDRSDAARAGKVVKKKVQVAEEELADYERPTKLKRKKQVVLSKDELLDYEDEHETWRQRRDRKKKKDEKNAQDEGRALKKIVKIDSEISVGELAKAMGAKLADVITQLMNLGIMANINYLVDFETASLVANEFGVTVLNTGRDDEEYLLSFRAPSGAEDLELRPPVVTVMGHVDHGKTSLLDAIRKTAVTKKEAGGITQHIGAYNVILPSGGSVTFLDTPGHEAFTAMRMRGAKVTDIVVLVVAADDGVMPQTIEALNHARAANVPIIVAVNKIDRENANPDRVKTQLSEQGLISEDWGGDTIFVPVSAHTRVGVDLLLENLYAQAEVLELKAHTKKRAVGTVVESKLDKGRGPVLTVLVQDGTLKRGDAFVCGSVWGKVRALVSSDGEQVNEAGPSIPVEVIGADMVPLAGDDFYVLESDAETRTIAERRARGVRIQELARSVRGRTTGGFTLENFSDMVSDNEHKEVPVIVKGDVQGSVEAVSQALSALVTANVRTKIIHKGAGAITENDVQLAVASKALIVGFNVRADTRAAAVAENAEVRIMYSRIIYELVDSVKLFMQGMEDPEFRETTLGRVEVRQTFKVPRLGVIAGSYVLDGVVQRGAQVRLLRDNRVIFEGKMASLRRFKEDVREVAAGYECGIGIEGYNDIKDGDIIEVFKVEPVIRPGVTLQ